MGDFYGTEIEIWAGFGPIGSTEKKRVWADNEQLLRVFFHAFRGKKILKRGKNQGTDEKRQKLISGNGWRGPAFCQAASQ